MSDDILGKCTGDSSCDGNDYIYSGRTANGNLYTYQEIFQEVDSRISVLDTLPPYVENDIPYFCEHPENDEGAETFSDVLFVPQFSTCRSRKNIDTTSSMGKFNLGLPVISANMKDITGPKMAQAMYKHGGLGILHRFGSIDDTLRIYHETVALLGRDWSNYSFGVSVGVKETEMRRFDELLNFDAKIFTVDVAHGHHILVKEMIEYMRNQSKIKHKHIVIIAGNVATPVGAYDLMSWGADIIKCGIGPGSACATRRNTGAGIPQLKAIRDIRKALPDIILISDGGIRDYGDIPKALKYSDAVMIGGLIAGTSETPGHVYQNPEGKFYKVYGGSASGENKTSNGQENTFVEGTVKPVPFKGKVKYILRNIKENLQSSMSYSGANDMGEFRKKSIMVKIGSGGKSESKL